MRHEIEKTALSLPHIAQGFKNVVLSSKPIQRAAKNAPMPIVGDGAAQAAGGTARMFSPDEIAEKIRERDINEGNGFVGDILLGGIKGIGNVATRAAKKDKSLEWAGSSAIDGASAKVKDASRNWSAQAGQKAIDLVGGNKPGSKRGKLFSVLEDVPVGERVLPDGTTVPIIEKQRRASIVAPAQNAMKVGTPLLGSMYLAEKFYPMEKREDTPSVGDMTQAAQQAAEQTVNPAVMRHMPRVASADVYQLEKRAMLDKQAMLESELLEKTAEADALRGDLDWMKKQASEAAGRAEAFEKRAADLQHELHDERAAHEELMLRTAARARSGAATTIARDMLEKGLIKRAQYEAQVDRLMDCSDDELKIFEKMASSEKVGEESLESLAFLSDTYSSSDEPSHRRVAPGLSKSGQTIHEAVRDILVSRNGG